MQTRTLGPQGAKVSAIGQGTWRMGESAERFAAEVAALQLGIELGMTLIDTAEMYAEGNAERVVAQAAKGVRERLFIVSKVWPNHHRYDDLLRSAEASLARLETDYLDLYLLHWPSAEHPLDEAMRALRRLVADGKVRAVGVSNFSVELMVEAQAALGDIPLACNQVHYNIGGRAVERAIAPHCAAHDITVMAYSPLGHGRLAEADSPGGAALARIAAKHECDAGQVALAWLIGRPGVVAIPKASRPEHVRKNAAAAELALDGDDLAALDAAFPVTGEFKLVRR